MKKSLRQNRSVVGLDTSESAEDTLTIENQTRKSALNQAQKWAEIGSGSDDLATNPAHMMGFGCKPEVSTN